MPPTDRLDLHPMLAHALHRGRLQEGRAPSLIEWRDFLESLGRAMEEAERNRRVAEPAAETDRAFNGGEMRALYDDLRRRSETELGLERDKLARNLAITRATLEASPDGILMVDERKRVVDYNGRFATLWGVPDDLLSRGDEVALLHFMAQHAEQPEAFLARARELYERPREECYDQIKLLDGRAFDRHGAPVPFPNGTFVRVWFFREITERQRTAEELRAAKDAAEQAARVKVDFLANMSHELRTPLNSILGFARVLDAQSYGPLNDRQKRHLTNIVHAGEHMLALVNDLLDLRRIEEERDMMEIVAVDLARTVDEAVALVRPIIEERQHALELDVPEDIQVRGDRRAVMQILVNLLSNAAKYTPPGGRISVAAEVRERRAVVSVRDTGVGIAPEDQLRLFTYYEQLGAKHQLHMKGSGIGLALTRALVERHGGDIHVESTPGRGSVFIFTLRLVAPRGGRSSVSLPRPHRGNR